MYYTNTDEQQHAGKWEFVPEVFVQTRRVQRHGHPVLQSPGGRHQDAVSRRRGYLDFFQIVNVN